MIKNFSNRPKFIPGETPLKPKHIRFYDFPRGYVDRPLYDKAKLTRRRRQKKQKEKILHHILSEEIQKEIINEILAEICKTALSKCVHDWCPTEIQDETTYTRTCQHCNEKQIMFFEEGKWIAK